MHLAFEFSLSMFDFLSFRWRDSTASRSKPFRSPSSSSTCTSSSGWLKSSLLTLSLIKWTLDKCYTMLYFQVSCVHPLERHLPQRHQASGNPWSLHSESSIVPSRIFCLIPSLESSSCATLEAPSIWSEANPTSPISALDTTGLLETVSVQMYIIKMSSGHLSWSLEPPTTQRTLMCGAPVAFLPSWCWARLVTMDGLGKVRLGCQQPHCSCVLNILTCLFFSRFSLVIAEWTNLWKSSRYWLPCGQLWKYLRPPLKGAGHPNQRADQGDEPQLHRV